MGVEHRQQRHSDANTPGRSEDPASHFHRLRVGRTIGRIVEVVELGDGGEPRLQHLDIELRGDRLYVIRRHRQREAIHGLAPCPERIGLPAPDLSEAGHGELEGVAVQVRRRRRHDRVTLVPRLR